jgi:streptogramin lyase
VVDRIQGDFYSLAVGEGYVWIAKMDPQGSTVVVRIDPQTDAPIEPSIQWGSAFRPFDAGEGGIWIIEGPPGGICRLNTETLRDDSCADPGGYADTGLNWPAALDTTTGTIWVANYQNTVTRIDLR